MIVIKETLEWITNYRNGLVKFMQTRLENLTRDMNDTPADFDEKEAPVYLRASQILQLLAEVELCNAYISYLTAWHLYYLGPTIPFDNSEVIKNVEHFIDKAINAAQIREALRKNFSK